MNDDHQSLLARLVTGLYVFCLSFYAFSKFLSIWFEMLLITRLRVLIGIFPVEVPNFSQNFLLRRTSSICMKINSRITVTVTMANSTPVIRPVVQMRAISYLETHVQHFLMTTTRSCIPQVNSRRFPGVSAQKRILIDQEIKTISLTETLTMTLEGFEKDKPSKLRQLKPSGLVRVSLIP